MVVYFVCNCLFLMGNFRGVAPGRDQRSSRANSSGLLARPADCCTINASELMVRANITVYTLQIVVAHRLVVHYHNIMHQASINALVYCWVWGILIGYCVCFISPRLWCAMLCFAQRGREVCFILDVYSLNKNSQITFSQQGVRVDIFRVII